MGDEATAQPHQPSSHQSEERLDLVVAELDSLLDALSDISADQSREPDVTGPTEVGPTEVGPTEVEPTTPLLGAPSEMGRSQSVPAAPPPTELPTTRPSGAREERSDIDDPARGIASGTTGTDGVSPASPASRKRRLVIVAIVLVTTAMVVLIGDTLGGLIGGGASDGEAGTEQTSQSPPTVEIVTHRFSGTGSSTTDWFSTGTEFRAVWDEAPETASEVALETESGTRITITPESGTGAQTFFPPDTYHLIVETDDPWAIRLVRVVTD